LAEPAQGNLRGDDYATVAYDASTGERVWVTRCDGPVSEFDRPRALGLSPDGSQVFVTGASFGATGYDYAAVASDGTNGAELWSGVTTRRVTTILPRSWE